LLLRRLKHHVVNGNGFAVLVDDVIVIAGQRVASN
jgi:hypothetical protein